MGCSAQFSSSVAMILTSSCKQQQFNSLPISFISNRAHLSSSRCVLTFGRRRGKSFPSIANKKKPSLPQTNIGEDDDLDEDAFEALFRQLEEDLKNDDPSALDGDEDISEEDLALLERELEEALGDEELQKAFSSSVDESEMETRKEGINNDEEEDDYDDEEEKQVVLKNWQIRRLAYALKNGRRKTSIKNLAAETCLDRAFVLELLRDPPPKLLLMSASLPDIPAPTIVEPKTKPEEDASSENAIESEELDTKKPGSKVKVPVHAMQSSWSAQKRIKKVQLDTLERVYGRTKRPTNAMISNIVHVTNLPRKRVVKWFEDKRTEDEVPDRRVPYQRSTPETVSSS
ncbi:protein OVEREXPRESSOR OF CATIONIC PEROXIDASE 3 isoform X1 [Daucus carota subsp. sativus]|uniref:Homeobox domain-containing protein n=1 Tax=Daucus carota subsp. sativus TaxID=79200 RepID=A0A162ALH0_DAUCS|nr:PREDICTED: protein OVEREXPRESSOR OF CATIONIC PEROXIDASE 3 [Daucus carota subsp. sativus]